MASASGWGQEPADINAEELYRHSSPDVDYSTRGSIADLGATFGGVLLLLTSGMELLQGMAAVANADIYAAGTDYTYSFNIQVWGWIHIVIAVVSAVVAIGILMRKPWAQVSGVVVAGFAMIGNFAFLPRYPLWAIIVIALDALVIWALLTQFKRYK